MPCFNMSAPANTQKREQSKCREWEKDRRNRLNTNFTSLSKLLPCYDPSLTLSKISILEKATAYIEELQLKVKDLLSSESVEKAEREEIKKLQDRVKKLLLRNEQLTNLLKDAGISVPSEYGRIKKFNKPLPWSNRITPEQAKILASKLTGKENLLKNHKTQNKKCKSQVGVPKAVICKQKQNVFKQNDSKKVKHTKKSNKRKIPATNCLILVSQSSFTNTPPCYIIANAPSKEVVPCSTGTTTIVTSSKLLTTPIVTSSVKAAPKQNTPLESLGPGTLILANGSVVPVLPQSALLPHSRTTIIANPAPILVNPQPPNPTLIVVRSTAAAVTTSSTKVSSDSSKLTKIKPKMCTRTVQINKVPIPALSSAYSSLQSVLANETTPTNIKTADKPKKVQENLPSKDKTVVSSAESTNSKKDVPQSSLCVVFEENKEKRKADCELSTNDVNKIEAKRSKLDNDTKKPEESKAEKEDPKNATNSASNYSIDSLCKEGAEKKKKEEKTANAEIRNTSVPEVKEINKTEISQSTPVTTLCTATEDSTRSIMSAENEKTAAETIVKSPGLPESVLKEIENHQKKAALTIETNPKALDINLPNSDFSGDIFASLQVPASGQHPESTSPTAAFLDAFPITLTGVKVTEVMDEENSDSQQDSHTLLQIGTMTPTKTTQSNNNSEGLTPNLLNLDSFSFFTSSKDICGSLYNSLDNFSGGTYCNTTTVSCSTATTTVAKSNETKKENFQQNEKEKQVYESTNYPAKQNQFISVAEKSMDTKSSDQNSFAGSDQKTSTTFKHTNTNIAKTDNNTIEKAKHHDMTIIKSSNAISFSRAEYYPYSSASNIYQHTHTMAKPKENTQIPKTKPSVSYSSIAVKPNYSSCNTFNPFTDVIKSSSSLYTSVVSKPYTEPLYTNCTSYNYNYHPESNFCQNPYRNISKADKSYYGVGYETATTDYNNFGNNYCQIQTNLETQNKEKFNSGNSNKIAPTQPKPPVNWMTAPEPSKQQQMDYPLSSFINKDVIETYSSQNQLYFNNSNNYTYTMAENLNLNLGEPKKSSTHHLDTHFTPSYHQKNELEDTNNQFSWSPTKLPNLLDPQPPFVSSTLPTLVGDLALGNMPQFGEPQTGKAAQQQRTKGNEHQQNNRRNKTQGYDNNVFSVSQLVQHNSKEGIPARTVSRRNSGGRNPSSNASAKSVSHKSTVKRHNHKDIKESASKTRQAQHANGNNIVTNNYSSNNAITSDWLDAVKTPKHPPSSYSAEALISSHQPSTMENPLQRQRNQQQTQTSCTKLSVPFLSENVFPSYFPSVEQDSFAQQTTQNYQNNNFCASIQNNSYTANSLIPSAPTGYMPSTNFMPDLSTPTHDSVIHDNLNLFSSSSNVNKPDTKCYSKSNKVNTNRSNEEHRNNSNTTNTVASIANNAHVAMQQNNKKVNKRKPSSEVHGFDFSFLSIPSAINSPILPDDFHSNFLPPPTPQLYPCKTPLYSSKQSAADLNTGSLLPLPHTAPIKSNVHHIEAVPPSGSSNNAGTSSLTNFTLSAIFPEINKSSTGLGDVYSDQTRNKDYDVHRNYVNSSQVPFYSKHTTYGGNSSYSNS